MPWRVWSHQYRRLATLSERRCVTADLVLWYEVFGMHRGEAWQVFRNLFVTDVGMDHNQMLIALYLIADIMQAEEEQEESSL
jgi:hypothetical protein